MLYRHMHSSLNFAQRNRDWKLCIPRSLRAQVLAENHDTPTAGHLGIAKTISRVAQNYYWPGMQHDIAQYVRECDICQEHKPEQKLVAGKKGTCNATKPWEYVSMDIAGPFV